MIHLLGYVKNPQKAKDELRFRQLIQYGNYTVQVDYAYLYYSVFQPNVPDYCVKCNVDKRHYPALYGSG